MEGCCCVHEADGSCCGHYVLQKVGESCWEEVHHRELLYLRNEEVVEGGQDNNLLPEEDHQQHYPFD